LSIGVAIAAAIALVASITKGGVDVLGLAADPTLLSIGAVGLMLALTTFRSPLISPFLRVFSTIFAVEYVVTGLAYLAVQADWWPSSFLESAPPASIPTAVAIFGLLVHLISFIPVIRQITRLADPYFMTNDRGDLQIGGFGARHVTERRFASSLIVAIVVINQLQVAINVSASARTQLGWDPRQASTHGFQIAIPRSRSPTRLSRSRLGVLFGDRCEAIDGMRARLPSDAPRIEEQGPYAQFGSRWLHSGCARVSGARHGQCDMRRGV
jgi:hypothetical protein